MPAKGTIGGAALILLVLTVPAAAEDKQQPDVALLEYLGEWAGNDKDWTDPVDLLDMKIDDKKDNDKAKASEKRK